MDKDEGRHRRRLGLFKTAAFDRSATPGAIMARVCATRRSSQLAATSTAQRRSTVGTATDCYCVAGRGEDRENAGVKDAEVITARLVRDERGWFRLAPPSR